jgi:hypothetical protein
MYNPADMLWTAAVLFIPGWWKAVHLHGYFMLRRLNFFDVQK